MALNWEKRQQWNKSRAEEFGQPFSPEPPPQIHDDVFEFAPWGDRLLVLREKPRERSGAIIVPDSARGMPAAGWVVSVGEGVTDLRLGVRAAPIARTRLLGCKVIFSQYAGVGLVVSDDNFSDNFRSAYCVLDIGSVLGTQGQPPEEPLL